MFLKVRSRSSAALRGSSWTYGAPTSGAGFISAQQLVRMLPRLAIHDPGSASHHYCHTAVVLLCAALGAVHTLGAIIVIYIGSTVTVATWIFSVGGIGGSLAGR